MKKISASEVVNILAATVYHTQETRQMGTIARQTATRIKQEVRNDKVPEELRRAGVNFFSAENSRNRFSTEFPELVLTSQTDLQTQDMVIKIVPGNEVKGRTILKVALTQTARREGRGGIFLTGSGKLVEIDEVDDLQEQLLEVAGKALEIEDLHDTLKNRTSLKGASRDAVNRKEIRLQREIKEKAGGVLQQIQTRKLKWGK